MKVGVWEPTDGGVWRLVGQLDTWLEVHVEPRWNTPGPWSMLLPLDGQSLKVTPRHLVTFDTRGTRMTGRVTEAGSEAGEDGNPTLPLAGLDVMGILGGVQCWPVPSSPIGSQTAARYQANGAAEDVLTVAARANLARAHQVTVPNSRGRGTPVTLNTRFKNLLELLQVKCEAADLGFTLGLVDEPGTSTRARLTLQFTQPVDRSARVRLSTKVGTLRSWKQNRQAPTATRAVVGGGGQGAARVFRQVVDTAAEAEWGFAAEVFVDARDTSDPALLDARGWEALAEAAAQSSFELDAAEAAGMRYGTHFWLGDKVTVELLTDTTTVDRLRAVRIDVTRGEGMSVQLIPGNPDSRDNPLFKQAAINRGLHRRLKALEEDT